MQNKLLNSRRTYTDIYIVSILISILLSWWLTYNHDVINRDGVVYLESAKFYLEHGFKALSHVCTAQCRWPFYSILIAHMSRLMHTPLELTAYIINGTFSLMSVLLFITIVKRLGGDYRVGWLAALVILIASYFNRLRPSIIRDHGFWAFYLASFLAFICYLEKPKWRYALLWLASIMAAALFRLEGFVFLLFLPLAPMFNFKDSSFVRVKNAARLYMPAVVVLLALLATLFLRSHDVTLELGRFVELRNRLFQIVPVTLSSFTEHVNMLTTHVLPRAAKDHANVIVYLFTLLSWYAVILVATLTFIYSLLVVYACIGKKLILKTPHIIALWMYVVINFAMTFLFLIDEVFLSKRYLMALSLTLMLLVPFALDAVLRLRHKLLLKIIIVLLLLAMAVGGVFNFGHSKKYIRDAGIWLRENAPKDASVTTNEVQVLYYAGLGRKTISSQGVSQDIASAMANDYVAWRVNKREIDKYREEFTNVKLKKTKTFSNERGDRIIIFKK